MRKQTFLTHICSNKLENMGRKMVQKSRVEIATFSRKCVSFFHDTFSTALVRAIIHFAHLRRRAKRHFRNVFKKMTLKAVQTKYTLPILVFSRVDANQLVRNRAAWKHILRFLKAVGIRNHQSPSFLLYTAHKWMRPSRTLSHLDF